MANKLALCDVSGLLKNTLDLLSGEHGAEWADLLKAVERGEMPSSFPPGRQDGFRSLGRLQVTDDDEQQLAAKVIAEVQSDPYIKGASLVEHLLACRVWLLLERRNYAIIEATLDELGHSGPPLPQTILAAAGAKRLMVPPLPVAIKFMTDYQSGSRTPRGTKYLIYGFGVVKHVRLQVLRIASTETDLPPLNVRYPATVTFTEVDWGYDDRHVPGAIPADARFLFVRA